MSYEDLEKAKVSRAAKETAKEAKKAENEVKKVEREAKKIEKEAKKAAKEAEQATTGKNTRGRKRKSPADADALEPQDKVVQMSEASEPVGFQPGWLSEEQQVAPVARMV